MNRTRYVLRDTARIRERREAEIERKLRAGEHVDTGMPSLADVQRSAYLQKRCRCGSGLGDGLCVNCWPQ